MRFNLEVEGTNQRGLSEHITGRICCALKNSGQEDDTFAKIGLSPTSYDDARKKYGKLTRAAL